MSTVLHSSEKRAHLFALPTLREILLIVTASWLLALVAQVHIPLPHTPIPITMGSFGVLLIGALLGARLGFWTLLSYLAQGVCGLPILSGWTTGLPALMGPKGGYLFGWVVAAAITGWLCERVARHRLIPTFFATAIGSAIIWVCGILWLGIYVGWNNVLLMGLYPFMVIDLIKSFAVAYISCLPAVHKRIASVISSTEMHE